MKIEINQLKSIQDVIKYLNDYAESFDIQDSDIIKCISVLQEYADQQSEAKLTGDISDWDTLTRLGSLPYYSKESHVSVSVASSDVGKCTKCKFNINDHCRVGTHYAEKGLSKFCIEGELWEATDR